MVLGGALGLGFVACDARGAVPLCVAGVALGDIHLDITWHAWHLWYWVAPLGWDLSPVTPGAPRHFAWQAWHLVTSTLISRGRRGTNSHPPSFCVAGVALMGLGGALGPVWSRMTPRHFAWQAWHNLTSTFVLHVAGVARSHIHLRFAWQAWHSWDWVARLDRHWSPDDAAALCVAGMAQPHIHRRFARGRRGTKSHPPSFCVAGVAAWHSWDWVARLDRFGRV